MGKKQIDETYFKKQGLELVTWELLDDLNKTRIDLNASENQPIKHCWQQAVYNGKLRQVESLLDICETKPYISNYKLNQLFRRYKKITGISLKDKRKQMMRA